MPLLANAASANGAQSWVDLTPGTWKLLVEVPSGETHTVTFHERTNEGVAASVTESGVALELSESVPSKLYVSAGNELRATIANYDTNPITVKALRVGD